MIQPRAEAPACFDSPVVFQLEGELLQGDTLLPFLIGYARWRGRRFLPLRLRLLALARRFGFLDASRALELMLTAACAGETIDNVTNYADWFAHTWTRQHVCFQALGQLRAYQQAGRPVVVVTASPDLYAAALADHLGLNDILCTRTELIDEQFTGRLAGPMMTGEQAARPGLPTVAWTPTVAA